MSDMALYHGNNGKTALIEQFQVSGYRNGDFQEFAVARQGHLSLAKLLDSIAEYSPLDKMQDIALYLAHCIPCPSYPRIEVVYHHIRILALDCLYVILKKAASQYHEFAMNTGNPRPDEDDRERRITEGFTTARKELSELLERLNEIQSEVFSVDCPLEAAEVYRQAIRVSFLYSPEAFSKTSFLLLSTCLRRFGEFSHPAAVREKIAVYFRFFDDFKLLF